MRINNVLNNKNSDWHMRGLTTARISLIFIAFVMSACVETFTVSTGEPLDNTTTPPQGGQGGQPPVNNNPVDTVLPLLDPLTQPKFVNPLAIPKVASPDKRKNPGFDYYELAMTQMQQYLGLVDPVTGRPLVTTVWGYGGSYPGPTIEARSTSSENRVNPGSPVQVLWSNELPVTHLLPLDTTLDCATVMPGCRPEVRTVTHLHGGHTDAASDGHPEAWFTPGFTLGGPTFDPTMRGVYNYRNDQEATALWYHDHSMGTTRLNVYAGLAGFYLIRDDNEDHLLNMGYLPQRAYEIPLLIQDRSFYKDGSLYYPNESFKDPVTNQPLSLDPMTGQPVPSVQPEFFGDFILVNGKTWPVLEVEPRKYRFRMLNGSNSRFYAMEFNLKQMAGATTVYRNLNFFQIGTDGGLLNAAVETKSLLLAPAERADIVMDFSQAVGETIILTNDARSPFPMGDSVDPLATGQIMAFKVAKPLNFNIPDSKQPQSLRPVNIPHLRPMPGVPGRELILSEGTDQFGRLLPLLGTSEMGPLHWWDPTTETPRINTTEIWSIINTTPDTHPVHQHLVQFQIMDRQRFDTATYVAGRPGTLQLLGSPMPPGPQESGWKDTVRANPGEVVRIIAHYDLLGEYVWHCHILEHEDHQMMRRFEVIM